MIAKNTIGYILGSFLQHTDDGVYEKSLEVVRFMEETLGATIVNITIPSHLSHGMKLLLSEFGLVYMGMNPNFIVLRTV